MDVNGSNEEMEDSDEYTDEEEYEEYDEEEVMVKLFPS
jgi:hypothetical protein